MCITPIFIKKTMMYVPCGKCGTCLKRKIQDYVIRCQEEYRKCKRSYWVTLTYERDPLQIYKKDLQDFFKRMRKAGFEFGYFALGDYGDTFGRPHYHAIFFVKGFFIPEYLHSLWISGRDQTRTRGFVHIRPLTMGRIAYAVRYGYLAKLDFKKDDQRNKPFFLMSKRPALGASYVTQAMRRHHHESNKWFYNDGKYKKALPRYYRDKLFSKLDRARHQIEYALEAVNQRDRDIKAAGSYREYCERLLTKSDNYLILLRRQKQLKQKIL